MPTNPTPAALIAEGVALKARIAKDSERLKQIAGELTDKLPAGKHEGDGGASCSIVAPSPSVKPTAEDVDSVRGIVGDEAFKKLFIREVSFSPVKGFREVLGAIVDGRKTNQVLRLVEKASGAYVKWGA